MAIFLHAIIFMAACAWRARSIYAAMAVRRGRVLGCVPEGDGGIHDGEQGEGKKQIQHRTTTTTTLMDAHLQHTEIRQLTDFSCLRVHVRVQALQPLHVSVERSFGWLEAVQPLLSSPPHEMQLYAQAETSQRLSKYLKEHQQAIAAPRTQTMTIRALLPVTYGAYIRHLCSNTLYCHF